MFPLPEIHLTAEVIRFIEEKHIISVEVCPFPPLWYLSEVYITPETCVWVLAWEHSFCMKQTLYLLRNLQRLCKPTFPSLLSVVSVLP